MTWIEERLGNVLVDIIGGGTPSRKVSAHFEGDIPWATVKDLDSFDLRDTEEYITKEALDISASKLIPSRNVILATRVGLGKVAYNHVDVAINQDLKALIPNKDVLLSEYLAFFLMAHAGMIEQQGVGSTVKGVTVKQLVKWIIPLPPLLEQKRVIEILRTANKLRDLRRRTIEKARRLLQAVFINMFGDPAKNPKHWKIGTLGDVIYAAQDGPHVSPAYSEAGIPFLSTRNIRAGEIIWEDLKYISPEEAEKHWKKCKPSRGDILYTKGGTTGLAKVVDFDDDVAIWVHIALLKTNNKVVDPLWLENMLNSDYCYAQSQSFTRGIANRDLGLTRMVKIKMYVPPLSIQREYADIASKIKATTTPQSLSVNYLDDLFYSLLFRAFTGNLTEIWREENREVVEAADAERDAILGTESVQRAIPPEEKTDLTTRYLGREIILDALSRPQRNLLRLIDSAEGYVTIKSIEDENDLGAHGLTRGLVQQGLAILEQTGLIHRINVPYQPSDRETVFYIPAYRALRPKLDQADDRRLLNTFISQTHQFREQE